MTAKRFNISLPKSLVKSLDEAAESDFVSRSAYIREAVSLRLRLDSYLKHEFTTNQSYFSILKAERLQKSIRRSINSSK